jgi:hypothetical protein
VTAESYEVESTATAYRLLDPEGTVLVVVERCRHALGPLRGSIGRELREHLLTCLPVRIAGADGIVEMRRRRRMTRRLLIEVARVYRSALRDGEPPTLAVATHFTVAHRTAGRYVSEARKAGELGPAVGTTAGEITI